MVTLALRNLARRPVRSLLTLISLALAICVLASLSALGEGYRSGLRGELDRMGMQMMLVPLGCPYDAAARVLKGKNLEYSLPESALAQARRDPGVAVAAPVLMAVIPRPEAGRTDMWAGIDEEALKLRPWWKAAKGAAWFSSPDAVILGSEAAAVEMREPGDRLHSPETGRTFTVAGVLERSGTSDDSLFFVPLSTAQSMFGQAGRLTAISLRLKDPTASGEAGERLQTISGAQVVTLTEMMGAFLNLVGSARTLVAAIGVVAVLASALGVFNTLFGSVVERSDELSVMRALGASRGQIFGLVALEALLLTGAGTLLGIGLAVVGGDAVQNLVRSYAPYAPEGGLLTISPADLLRCATVGLGVGLAAALLPAWRAGATAPAGALRSV